MILSSSSSSLEYNKFSLLMKNSAQSFFSSFFSLVVVTCHYRILHWNSIRQPKKNNNNNKSMEVKTIRIFSYNMTKKNKRNGFVFSTIFFSLSLSNFDFFCFKVKNWVTDVNIYVCVYVIKVFFSCCFKKKKLK